MHVKDKEYIWGRVKGPLVSSSHSVLLTLGLVQYDGQASKLTPELSKLITISLILEQCEVSVPSSPFSWQEEKASVATHSTVGLEL